MDVNGSFAGNDWLPFIYVSALTVVAEVSYNAFVTRLSAKLHGAKSLVTSTQTSACEICGGRNYAFFSKKGIRFPLLIGFLLLMLSTLNSSTIHVLLLILTHAKTLNKTLLSLHDFKSQNQIIII